MAVKKSDLYSSLWASCDELRGGMDASQYKDYVLFMLCHRPQAQSEGKAIQERRRRRDHQQRPKDHHPQPAYRPEIPRGRMKTK